MEKEIFNQEEVVLDLIPKEDDDLVVDKKDRTINFEEQIPGRLQANHWYTYEEMATILKQPIYSTIHAQNKQIKQWGKAYTISRGKQGKYLIKRVRHPESIVVEQFFTNYNNRYYNSMLLILLNLLSEESKKKANEAEDYTLVEFSLSNILQLFCYCNVNVQYMYQYLPDGETEEREEGKQNIKRSYYDLEPLIYTSPSGEMLDIPTNYPFIYQEYINSWRAIAGNDFVRVLKALKKMGSIDYDIYTKVYDIKTEQWRIATDAERGNILTLRNELLLKYGISEYYKIHTLDLKRRKAFEEEYSKELKKRLNIGFYGKFYEVWTDKRHIQYIKDKIFKGGSLKAVGIKDENNFKQQLQMFLTQRHNKTIAAFIENRIEVYQNKILPKLSGNISNYDSFKQILHGENFSSADRAISYLFNTFENEIIAAESSDEGDKKKINLQYYNEPKLQTQYLYQYVDIIESITELFADDVDKEIYEKIKKQILFNGNYGGGKGVSKQK